MIKWDLSKRCKDSSTYAYHGIYHINKLKNKHHMTISIDVEQPSHKIQHPFMIKKNLQKVGIKGTWLNIIKAISDKHTANIILNGETLKAFFSKIRNNKARMSTPITDVQKKTVLEVLAMAIRNKKNPNWKRSKTVTVCR